MFCPSISVIIPVYNGEKDLLPLIDCLVSQTYNLTQVEFILVDNNSEDNTAHLIKEQAQLYQNQNIKIRYILADKIQSSYYARNQGIKNSEGKIIAFTDVDCRPQHDWLELLIQPFIDEKIMIVAGEIKGLKGNSILEKYAETNDTLSQKYTLANELYPYAQTANLAIRKEALQIIGLFRPYLTTGGDADICWRLFQELQAEIKFVRGALVFHRHRNNLKDFQSQWQRYGKSNQYLHQLHGLKLAKNYDNQAILLRIGRWIFQDIPKNIIKITIGKASFFDLIKAPIDIIASKARSDGQQKAILPLKAKEIEVMDQPIDTSNK
ncbi:MAG: glycosyltransferase [Cyanobacterium sp. T60_A2020_053]|nr:glycosyltransferase [Cyanobacterium sp. T60_A2020_053]